jgi:hypothetical protein
MNNIISGASSNNPTDEFLFSPPLCARTAARRVQLAALPPPLEAQQRLPPTSIVEGTRCSRSKEQELGFKKECPNE